MKWTELKKENIKMKLKHSKLFRFLANCMLAVAMATGLTACNLFGGSGGVTSENKAVVKIKVEVESSVQGEEKNYSEYTGNAGGYVSGGKSLSFEDGTKVEATTESVQTLLNQIKTEIGNYELANAGTNVTAVLEEVRTLTYRFNYKTQTIIVKNFTSNFADVKVSTAYDTNKLNPTTANPASAREDGWITIDI
ncbi:MAG: hypothetical protein LBM99_02050, partial [Bacillales bacterium]|nr:hypothetical protein [Bacillales bacterium]